MAYLVIYLIGGVLGCGIGYFTCHIVLDRQHEEEIAQLRQEMTRKRDAHGRYCK